MNIKTYQALAARHGCALTKFSGNLGMWTLHRRDGEYGTRAPRDYYRREVLALGLSGFEREVLDFLTEENAA